MQDNSITALTPDSSGHQFIFYGDCCSGIPGGMFEENFARVNSTIQRMTPSPDFMLFLGDHIMGPYASDNSLDEQWSYWHEKEMSWNHKKQLPIYHTTSNHDTFDHDSEQIWRNVFPDIPPNGPVDQTGLSYWIRKGDLLLVFVNTNFSGIGGNGHVECAWLDHTLRTHSDATYKIVAGHQPVFPVNGYDERPLWCIVEDEADAFWTVLSSHGVLAYLTSHVIAFDIQQHQGVLQICSGGAGTNYNLTDGCAPGAFMGAGEYHHFVQTALDKHSFQLQTIDIDGNVKERFTHPLPQ